MILKHDYNLCIVSYIYPPSWVHNACHVSVLPIIYEFTVDLARNKWALPLYNIIPDYVLHELSKAQLDTMIVDCLQLVSTRLVATQMSKIIYHINLIS